MPTVQLTLICALYNVREFIPELIDSLARGVNDPEVRVVFVNDCTPDDTMERCRQVLARRAADIRFEVRFIERDRNGGLSAARNSALEHVDSPYLGFIDGDDAVADTYYRSLAPHLKSGHWDLIEFDHAEFIGPLNAAPPVARTDADRATVTEATQLSPYHSGFFSWARLYRTALVRDLRFPAGRLYEDIRYVAEAYGRAQHILRLNETLVLYRKRQDSITTVQTRNHRFADQLLNLVEGTSVALAGHRKPVAVIALAARKALLILLKGVRIGHTHEREIFFQTCEAPLRHLRQLCRQHTSLGATVYLSACRLVIGLMGRWHQTRRSA